MNPINSKTVALQRAITDTINNCGLPPCVVGLVLDKLRAQVTSLEAQAIQQEAAKEEENRKQEAAE